MNTQTITVSLGTLIRIGMVYTNHTKNRMYATKTYRMKESKLVEPFSGMATRDGTWIHSACAIGAANVAHSLQPQSNAVLEDGRVVLALRTNMDGIPKEWRHTRLSDGAFEWKDGVPVNPNRVRPTLQSCIATLNDDYDWSRPKISYWVDWLTEQGFVEPITVTLPEEIIERHVSPEEILSDETDVDTEGDSLPEDADDLVDLDAVPA